MVELEMPRGEPGQGEMGFHPPSGPGTELAAPAGIPEQALKRPRQLWPVSQREKIACLAVLHLLGDASDLGRNDGAFASHRFQHGVREIVPPGGQNLNIRR